MNQRLSVTDGRAAAKVNADNKGYQSAASVTCSNNTYAFQTNDPTEGRSWIHLRGYPNRQEIVTVFFVHSYLRDNTDSRWPSLPKLVGLSNRRRNVQLDRLLIAMSVSRKERARTSWTVDCQSTLLPVGISRKTEKNVTTCQLWPRHAMTSTTNMLPSHSDDRHICWFKFLSKSTRFFFFDITRSLFSNLYLFLTSTDWQE